MRRYFKFYDNSIANLPINWSFGNKPIEFYTSENLGFGEWKSFDLFHDYFFNV